MSTSAMDDGLKMRSLKEEDDTSIENGDQIMIKYKEELKKREEAEAEVVSLIRRLQLLEQQLEKAEDSYRNAKQKYEEAVQAAGESERIKKALGSKINLEDDRIAQLEDQLSQAKIKADESDKKLEEMARRVSALEGDVEKAEMRAANAEKRCVELEAMLHALTSNFKSLDISEEKVGLLIIQISSSFFSFPLFITINFHFLSYCMFM